MDANKKGKRMENATVAAEGSVIGSKPMRAPKLIIHYATPGERLISYCGVERRSSSVPATSGDVSAVDCLTCLRAYHVMWGGAAQRIADVRRARERTAEFFGDERRPGKS